jgi:hypothetical protein
MSTDPFGSSKNMLGTTALYESQCRRANKAGDSSRRITVSGKFSLAYVIILEPLMINFRCRFYPTRNKFHLRYKNKYINVVRETIAVFVWIECKTSIPCVGVTKNLLGAFAKLQSVNGSFVVSVCPSAWNDSSPTERNFLRFDIRIFFHNLSGKLSFY